MPVKKFVDFLDRHNVGFKTIEHDPAFTAQEIAACSHVSGKKLAKTVMVKVDGQASMAVLPASFKVDVEQLRETLSASHVEIMNEREFQDRFPECEAGAMPPFGNLYGMKVFVAESLAGDEAIAFNAGTLTELIELNYRDYESLVQPEVKKFSFPA
jgi:Ala-tRNA(Pro) deacylase